MHTRPQTVTAAAILMALFSVMNFPGPWWYVFPETMEQTPTFIFYSGIVLGIVGIVAAIGLWMLKPWGFWLTIVVCVLNILLSLPAPVMVQSGGLLALIAVQTIGFILVVVLVVLPLSRRAFAAA
jgi:uncharacterized membrane protein (DUF2068 family)